MRPPVELGRYFTYWEITKDLIDQCIDIMLNLSRGGALQSSWNDYYPFIWSHAMGHPRIR